MLPTLSLMEEAPLLNNAGVEIGWHVNALGNAGVILGSGTHRQRRLAHTIAFAEGFERKIVADRIKSESAPVLLLNDYPTTCGFAVGFDRLATRERAVAESIERWLRSQWIDRKCRIPSIEACDVEDGFDRFSAYFRSQFDRILYFQTSTSMEVVGEHRLFHSSVVVGLSDAGAFVGSRTSADPTDIWSHALAEAWRHKIIFERTHHLEDPNYGAIYYFGTHQAEALRQISMAKCVLPAPSIRLLKEVETGHPGAFCFRALCHDFESWSGTAYDRFVY